MSPEVQAWIEEIKSYVRVGRALDGKDQLPDEKPPGLDTQGIVILSTLALFILAMTIALILQAVM